MRLNLSAYAVILLAASACTTEPEAEPVETTVLQPITTVPTPPANPNARVGIYNWGASPTGYSFTDMLNGPAGLVTQVGARTIRVALSNPDSYTSASFASLSAVAQSAAWQTLLSSTNFDTYILTTYSQADNPSNGCLPLWYNGYSQANAQAETTEIQNLAQYLGTTYSTKKFIIQNWEGDSAIGSLAHYCSEPLTTTMWQGYIGWINARSQGVFNARAAGVANVYSGLEFNSVQRLTSSDDYYGNNCAAPDATSLTAGCSWCDATHPCVISTVGPYVNVDYLSYSSWQSDGVAQATSCFNAGGTAVSCNSASACTACYGSTGTALQCPFACGGPSTPAPEDALVATRLENDLARAKALITGATPANFLIGEFGADRNYFGEARQANRMNYVVSGLTTFGASYGIYWQILDNAGGGGFGAYKPDGTEGLVGQAFNSYYTAPSIAAVWDDDTNVAGTAHTGEYISLYGSNFDPINNTVTLGGVALTITYNSTGQINCLLPTTVPTGTQTLVLTKVSSGATVSTTVTVIGPIISLEYDDNFNIAATAHEGDYISLYGSGFGTTNTVYLGGVLLTTTYNSATQINALLPSNVPTGPQTLELLIPATGQTAYTTVAVIGACSFTAPTTIAHNGYWSVSVASNPTGYSFYWYGTHNGTTDATNVYGGTTHFAASFGPYTVRNDRYTRYAVIRDAAGNAVCTTNTVAVTVQ